MGNAEIRLSISMVSAWISGVFGVARAIFS